MMRYKYFVKIVIVIVLLFLSTVSYGSEPEPIKPVKTLSMCSFNIQFLGHYKNKRYAELAGILKDYDIVAIQELVADPSSDPDSDIFVKEMAKKGFISILSDGDTGPGDRLGLNTTATEWFIIFIKPLTVQKAPDLPSGFLARDRSHNIHYDRVPYAFPLRSDNFDFVLINVHLHSGEKLSDINKRKHEMFKIEQWINIHNAVEKDFIIVGDFNTGSSNEMYNISNNYISLNSTGIPTNILKTKPYDNVYFNPIFSREIDTKSFSVIDLRRISRRMSYNRFKQLYSDHNPIIFSINILEDDD